MQYSTFFSVLALFLYSCSGMQDMRMDHHSSPEPAVITFGSCSKLNKPQLLWDDIAAESPDAFVWLGDIIYGDTEDMELLQNKYKAQKAKPEYAALRRKTGIYGIWDDHDYGKNDGGKEYPKKDESKEILFDFLDIHPDNPARQHQGVYQDYILDKHSLKIHLILLDERYFRDSLERPNGVYQPNDTGTILGETQWKWLAQTLDNSPADVVLIGSGTQVFPEEHRFEKWANFPRERTRLIRLLEASQKPVIILSGDRHFGEISMFPSKGKYPIYEVTSSSLTHTFPVRDEPNKYRLGQPVTINNYGVVKVTNTKDQLQVVLQLKADNGQTVEEHTLFYKH